MRDEALSYFTTRNLCDALARSRRSLRSRALRERIVERRDARPVRVRRGARARVAGGDRSLECIRTEPPIELLGTLERGETAAHEQMIPARAVLIEEQNGLSRRADPGA